MLKSGDTLPGFFPGTAMPDPDWWQALWPQPEHLLAGLGIKPGMSVVDLCCGDGLFTIPLARMARSVVAIDLDPEMLRIAKARAAAAGLENLTFIAGDAYDVATVTAEPADFVLIANTFHGVPDKPRLAAAVAAVLKPGDTLAIVNWHKRPREDTEVLGKPRGPKARMTPDEVAAAIEPAGFKPAGVIELPPYHYAALFRKPSTSLPNDGDSHER
jgi:ubiquinone/menaquinone biosynthesis C-methylase UbiE